MFDYRHYVPILKCKQGERFALSQLVASASGKATPLLEVEAIPRAPDTDELTRTPEAHCSAQLEQGVVAWGVLNPFFLDPEEIASHQTQAGVSGPQHLYDEAGKLSLKFIPVLGLRRSPAEMSAARAHSQRGICLRLDENDFGPGFPSALAQFLNTIGLGIDAIDLMIDLASVYQSPLPRVFNVAMAYLNAIPNIQSWRTLTLAASAFPESMGELQGSSTATFARLEWLSWAHAHTQRTLLPRMPTFGDYGVQHPELVEGLDFRVVQVSAAIRYTLPNEWLIIKGQGMRNVKGSIQFPQLAKALVSRPEFMGAAHCLGCQDAVACASGKTGFGSPSPWRRIGAVHHVTVTLGQLAALPFP